MEASVGGKLEMTWEEAAVTYLEKLKDKMINFYQNSLSPNRASKKGPPEYKAKVLTAQP
jgi:hypothetical protein